MKNWQVWLQGLGAAALGGAGAGFTQAVTANGGKINTATGISAGVGAIFTAVAYLMHSPRLDGALAEQAATLAAAPAIAAPPTQPGQ